MGFVVTMGVHVAGQKSTEWWMHPGEYWDDGLVCYDQEFGGMKSTYCSYEPNIAEKLWDWNWAHVVEPTFPVVWIVLGVLAFIWTAGCSGWHRSRGERFEDYGWMVCAPAIVFGALGFLWQLYIAATLVFGVWFGIFWLTGKRGLAALRRRQAAARERREKLLDEAETLEKLAGLMLGDGEADYRAAALAAATSLKEQAGEVKS